MVEESNGIGKVPMIKPLQIAIGYDKRESIAFHTLVNSIMIRASEPVSIIPIVRSSIRAFHRPRGPLDSTDFSISRFMVPYICGYKGVTLFMDCDIVVKDDIVELFRLFDPAYAVQVVKHNHVPKETVKMDDQVQTKYSMKNWTSVMLFNNERCTALTPEYVNKVNGLDLHQFQWLPDKNLIGELPETWNHLVGYSINEYPSAFHYTCGGPWFEKYRQCEDYDKWVSEYLATIEPFKFWYGTDRS